MFCFFRTFACAFGTLKFDTHSPSSLIVSHGCRRRREVAPVFQVSHPGIPCVTHCVRCNLACLVPMMYWTSSHVDKSGPHDTV